MEPIKELGKIFFFCFILIIKNLVSCLFVSVFGLILLVIRPLILHWLKKNNIQEQTLRSEL